MEEHVLNVIKYITCIGKHINKKQPNIMVECLVLLR